MAYTRIQLVTGREDRLLRSLRLAGGVRGRRRRPAATGPRPLARARLSLELDVARPNRPVAAPDEPRALPLPFGG